MKQKIQFGFKTDIGRKRAQNQDGGIASAELGLFVVADGMGGHQGGEIASALAVETIAQSIERDRKNPPIDTGVTLERAIQAANERIFERALAEPHLKGMGTTTTALLFEPGVVTIGQVGDSRCYYFRGGLIWQLTRDHSMVEEKLRAGLITRKELKTDQMKNVITRSVGFERKVESDLYQMELKDGDVFLICSDGLTGMLDDLDILKIVQTELFTHGDAQRATEELVEAANAKGGDDNITAGLVQVFLK